MLETEQQAREREHTRVTTGVVGIPYIHDGGAIVKIVVELEHADSHLPRGNHPRSVLCTGSIVLCTTWHLGYAVSFSKMNVGVHIHDLTDHRVCCLREALSGSQRTLIVVSTVETYGKSRPVGFSLLISH